MWDISGGILGVFNGHLCPSVWGFLAALDTNNSNQGLLAGLWQGFRSHQKEGM